MSTRTTERRFDESDVDAHVKLFSLWCLGVQQGNVAEMRFSLAPDDGELTDWSARLHRENIRLGNPSGDPSSIPRDPKLRSFQQPKWKPFQHPK
jgi:hypothetical protein